MIKGFNHIGIAVKDLDSAVEFFVKIYGGELLYRKIYEDQKLESAFIAIGKARFELSAGLEPESLLCRYIATKGEGIHHVSLEVDHFGRMISEFKAKGLQVIAEADTSEFKAAFIHPRGNLGVLTEIIEPKRKQVSLKEDKD